MSSLFSVVSTPLGWVMKFIYSIVSNYGLTIILFTLFTKVIMFPLAIKQKKSTIKMNAFQPIIQDIQKKYANDRVKQQEELQRLQTEHGFSMTAGCLPLLIQMPILFGLIDVIYKPLHYVIGIPNSVINQITPIAQNILGDLSRYSPQSGVITAIQTAPQQFSSYLDAQTISFIQDFDMNFLGMNLTDTPSLKVFNMLLLIPVLSVAFMLIQQFLMMKLNGQKMEGMAKIMPLYSGAMFLYLAFVVPAGVSLYWIFTSVFGIAQELILRIFFDPAKEKEKIEFEIAEAKKAAKNKRPEIKKVKKLEPMKQDEPEYTADEADMVKKRLERARALDKEKYGE